MRAFKFPPVMAAAMLSGCAASLPSVETTRFHLGQPIEPAAFVLDAPDSLEANGYRVTVGSALTRLGFVEVESRQAAVYVAKLGFSRDTKQSVSRSAVSIGLGSRSFGRNFGVGVGTNIGLGGRKKTIIVTRIDVQLARLDDGKVIWEGRAQTEASAIAPAAQPGIAADKLTRALFSDFPGETGRTIIVR